MARDRLGEMTNPGPYWYIDTQTAEVRRYDYSTGDIPPPLDRLFSSQEEAEQALKTMLEMQERYQKKSQKRVWYVDVGTREVWPYDHSTTGQPPAGKAYETELEAREKAAEQMLEIIERWGHKWRQNNERILELKKQEDRPLLKVAFYPDDLRQGFESYMRGPLDLNQEFILFTPLAGHSVWKVQGVTRSGEYLLRPVKLEDK